MCKQPDSCSSKQIEKFLTESLGPEELNSFEQHLDRCDSCCESLINQTAAANRWHDVREYLNESPHSVSDLATCPKLPSKGHAVSLDFLAPTDDPRMLGRIGSYEIAGVVGQGGMGLVLKAFDPALNRYEAIKVLAPHYASSAAARQRFEREAQAAAAVVRDNVIAIHGVAEFAELPYLVMPYIRGESLQRRLDRCGPLSIQEILRISMQVALGLSAAHDQGLVHRDIKPANILLPESVDRVLITDFGLARAADDASLTRSGVIAGTPQYMSPEQARGEAVDSRSDLFSLGTVIYTMCTGRLPFRETPYGILRRITDTHPQSIREINSDIPDWLCRIVSKLHAKSSKDRYQSASEVAELICACLAHVQTPSTPLPGSLRQSTWQQSVVWAIGGVCTLLITVMTFVFFHDEPTGRYVPTGDETILHPIIASVVDARFEEPLAGDLSEFRWDDPILEAIPQLSQQAEALNEATQISFEYSQTTLP